MKIPIFPGDNGPGALIDWLGNMRNDLQEAAIEAAEPVIGQAFAAL